MTRYLSRCQISILGAFLTGKSVKALAFIKELRRRHVFRGAGIYIVSAWLVLQVADVILDPLGLKDTSRNWRKMISGQRLWYFESRDASAWLMI